MIKAMFVYYTSGRIVTITSKDLAWLIKNANMQFEFDTIYKIQIWNEGKAVSNRKTPDLLFELV